MTDQQALFDFRMNEARETLDDARKMLSVKLSPRSVVNRCYYAAFYAVLAFFLKNNVVLTTSRHSGIIGVFDREYVKTGHIDRKYSAILHQLFDLRQEMDYREFVVLSAEDAGDALRSAEVFVDHLEALLRG